MFNPFHSLIFLVFHFQLLFHPIVPVFPHSFPFINTTNIPTPTITPRPTDTPTPTISLIPSPTLIPTVTPTPTATPTATPIHTPTLTPSPFPTSAPEPICNDISYPQCNEAYPIGQVFGIVGVNGGLASTTNPCLSNELAWAANSSSSSAHQTKVQLYVNTGNPGGLNTVTWPHNNIDPQGIETTNPYGRCDGSNSTACAWQYGWNRAVDDVVSRFIPAAKAISISQNPADYPWWLDVESVNSWRDGSKDALQANAADLEGMMAYFTTKSVTPAYIPQAGNGDR